MTQGGDPSGARVPMNETINQVLSFVGAVLILGAYAARAFKLIAPNRALDLTLNLFGGLLLFWVALGTRQIGLILVEAAWALISLVGLLGLRRAS